MIFKKQSKNKQYRFYEHKINSLDSIKDSLSSESRLNLEFKNEQCRNYMKKKAQSRIELNNFLSGGTENLDLISTGKNKYKLIKKNLKNKSQSSNKNGIDLEA